MELPQDGLHFIIWSQQDMPPPIPLSSCQNGEDQILCLCKTWQAIKSVAFGLIAEAMTQDQLIVKRLKILLGGF